MAFVLKTISYFWSWGACREPNAGTATESEDLAFQVWLYWLGICVLFRWKGENVATTEVADVIGMLDFIQETNVYGVPVSGNNTFPTLKDSLNRMLAIV
jgi:hypothetical protein